MEKRALDALLRDHTDNEVVRIRWVSNDDVSAIVTTGELREAVRKEEIDPADIETLQFLS